jgi:lysozyme family protein
MSIADLHFDNALHVTLGIEGGFSDDANDRGGATKYGITEATARKHGYTGNMKDLPVELAKTIYRIDYWDVNKLGEISLIAPETAEELFDTGVNCGVGTAAKFLQRALNSLNQQGKLFPNLTVDGSVGSKTVQAVQALIDKRRDQGDVVLARLCNGQQAVRYIEICERDETQETFMFGWTSQRLGVK